MEIIQAFPVAIPEDADNDEEPDLQDKIINRLNKFKEWMKGYDFAKDILDELERKQQKTVKRKRKVKKTTTKDNENDEPEEMEEEIVVEDEIEVIENMFSQEELLNKDKIKYW